jgi:tRNA dimethylallyltransferase
MIEPSPIGRHSGSDTPIQPMEPVLIIAGPTASGKSALALAVALRLGGCIINADSMQSYADLCILTARPGPADEARVPHRLYGIADASNPMNAARWRDAALAAITEAQRAGLVPIIVGGTGLYLRVLIQGLADIPDIPEAVRAQSADWLAKMGAEGLHGLLATIDPAAAARLHPSDSQRIVRAYEVISATGRSLLDWQTDARAPHHTHLFVPVILEPERAVLYRQCDARFLGMMQAGALAEAEALAQRALPPHLPLMKALGVPELIGHLAGKLNLAEAVRLAQQATRRYAKRQGTWFRHQMPDGLRLRTADRAALDALLKYYNNIMTGMTKKISKDG